MAELAPVRFVGPGRLTLVVLLAAGLAALALLPRDRVLTCGCLIAAAANLAMLDLLLRLRRDRHRALQALVGLQVRLDLAVKDFRAADAEFDAFAYSVAHDLRAPLRAIDGFSRALIEDFAGQLEPEAARLLGIVRRNSVRMGRLMDDLLAYSRLSRQAMARQRLDPAVIVRRVLDDGAASRAGRDIVIALGELPSCDADPDLLARLYAVLLDNSAKFTRDVEQARIEIASRVDQGRTVYFVADNGVGFDMAYAGKLFGMFQRLHRADEYDGTGTGLAVARRIVHRHGGDIWAKAAPGEGAAFCFTLGDD